MKGLLMSIVAGAVMAANEQLGAHKNAVTVRLKTV